MHNIELLRQSETVSERLSALRKLHEVGNIANQVPDGGVPFPQNEQSIRDGISLEFRWFIWFFVLFRDADSAIVETFRSDTLAVRNMSYATSFSK
jgi:hypothetical protein